ncbi:MAG TPA: hypothetical protein DCL08_00255 [Anaerolineaceae bacterium]|nr:hypothetical protein [Anaerolineaceae bacterium]
MQIQLSFDYSPALVLFSLSACFVLMSHKQISLLFVLQTWFSSAPPLCLKAGDKDFIRNLLLSLDQILLQSSRVQLFVFHIFQLLFSSLKISKAGEDEGD